MKVRDPNYKTRVRSIFDKAPFIGYLGLKLYNLDPGVCETSLEIQEQHLQQNGLVHAGVLATMCDHTAGAAAGTLIMPDQIMLTAEFKVNLMFAVQAEKLFCRSRVLKAGARLSFAESELSASADFKKILTKASVTLAITSHFSG